MMTYHVQFLTARSGWVNRQQLKVGGSWRFGKSEIDQWAAGNAAWPDDTGAPVERKQ